ncbi:SOS response-associated peptidase [Reichenbachiella versicolor]|uniref:SOS response-associated peptidase n=1 Tax=Reichenbachiella versicolor TaxID=1821036 RepID=UPI000D6E81DD|nr:SOS response-associated peptidase family protein [Reichenbachiella versicolor]
MIDRYAIHSTFQEITERYGLTGEEEFMIPNFNASPSQSLPVITHTNSKEITFVNWAIISEMANNKTVSPKLLSIPIDTVLKKNSIKNALVKSRCIIPCNGFFAWKQYGKKRKVPHYFKHPEMQIVSMVGIWEEYEDIDGKIKKTFKILIKPNSTGNVEFGNLTPVLIKKDDEKKFIDDYSTIDELVDIIMKEDIHKELINYSVSSMITNPKYNRKELIEPHAQVDQLGNYTLFE